MEAVNLFEATMSLVILDVMMSEMNGYEACQKIRQQSQVQLIVATIIINNNTRIRTHAIKPNKQVISPHVHNVGCIFLLLLVIMEIITPIKESTGPASIISVYVYGAWFAL